MANQEQASMDTIMYPVAREKQTQEKQTQVPLNSIMEETTSKDVVLKEISDPLMDALTKQLVVKCKDIGVKKSTISVVIKYVIEAVEDTPVKGAAQKDYAVRLLRALIEELSQPDDKEYLLEAIDSGSIGDVIELIVSASKGELNLNKVLQTTTSMLPYCIALLSKCVKKPSTP